MKKLLLFVAAIGLSFAARAQSFDHSHAAFTTLLKKHVVVVDGGKASKVKYPELKKDQPQLKAYLDSLSAVSETEFNAWSKPQRMAFLINAYNGFTLALVLTRYPGLDSIKDLGSLLQSPWKKKFFTLFGEEWWLDRIEPRERERVAHEHSRPTTHWQQSPEQG